MSCEERSFVEILIENGKENFPEYFSYEAIEDQVTDLVLVVFGSLAGLSGIVEDIIDAISIAVDSAVQEYERDPEAAKGFSVERFLSVLEIATATIIERTGDALREIYDDLERHYGDSALN
jgi:hypothetical protein